MRLRGIVYLLVALIAVMLTVIVASLRMRMIESKFLPILFASLGLILCSIALWQEVRRGRSGGATVEDTGETVAERPWSGYLANTAWVAGYVLGIWVLGLVVATLVFMLAYTKRLGTGWWTSIISSIVTSGFIYLIFEKAMHITLYRGLIFGP